MQQSVQEILSLLSERGIKLWLEGGELRFRAIKGTFPSELLANLRARRAEVVEELKSSQLRAATPRSSYSPACPIPATKNQLAWWRIVHEHWGGFSERLAYTAVRIAGPLNVELLQISLDAVVRRHESLRTRLVMSDGILRQQIDPFIPHELDVIDLTKQQLPNAPSEVAKQRAEQFLKEKVDLSIGPLFSAKLFRLTGLDHVLVLALDHVITDDASNNILNRDIWTLYRQASQGLPFSLPPLEFQPSDYALLQQQTYDARLEKHGPYWKRRLAGAPRIEIPLDKTYVDVRNPVCSILKIMLGGPLTAKLLNLARLEHTLLPVVILTIYSVVMSDWCNQRDLVLATLWDGRDRLEIQDTVGFFASAMWLRIQLDEADTVITLLRKARLEAQAAYEHQEFSHVPDVVPECYTEIGFNWGRRNLPSQLEDDGVVRIQPFPLEAPWPFRFIVSFHDTEAGVMAVLTYRADLFMVGTVNRWGNILKFVAEMSGENPNARLTSILMRAKYLASQ